MSCLSEVVVPPVNGTVADVEASDKALWDKVWIGVGIFLGILGSVLINLGNNMQALAMHRSGTLKAKARWAAVHERANVVHALTPDGQLEARRSRTVAVAATAGPVYSDETLAALARLTRIKNGGTAIFIFGSVINFAAFAFAAASVLAPLEAVQFITNLVFGKCVHGLAISRRMKVGSALTAVGVGIAVGCGPMSVFEFSMEDLLCFWRDPIWLAFVGCAYAAALVIMAYWYVADRQVQRSLEPGAAARPWRFSLTLLPVAYALSSALIGTQSVVQAKCMSEIASMLFSGQAEAIGTAWLTYLVLAYFIVTVAFWLYRLHDALGKYQTLFIIPLLQSSYIVCATVAGGIYFQEFSTLGWWQFVAFFSGLGVMLLGLVLLIPPNPEKSLEAVSVYEGLRLERLAREAEEEESRKEEKSSRNLLREHTPSEVSHFLREHTPSFVLTKVCLRASPTKGDEHCDPSVLARAGRSASPCDEPVGPVGKEAAGAANQGDLTVEEIGSTSPALERHDVPRSRRVSRELQIAETWVSRELAARELGTAVGGALAAAGGGTGLDRAVAELAGGTDASGTARHSASTQPSYSMHSSVSRERLGGVAEPRERTPSGQLSRHGSRRGSRRPSFSAMPLGVSAIDANALGGRLAEMGPPGRPHQVSVGDAHAGAGAEADAGNSPRAHGGVHDGVSPPRSRFSRVNEGSERCERLSTTSYESAPVDKLPG